MEKIKLILKLNHARINLGNKMMSESKLEYLNSHESVYEKYFHKIFPIIECSHECTDRYFFGECKPKKRIDYANPQMKVKHLDFFEEHRYFYEKEFGIKLDYNTISSSIIITPELLEKYTNKLNWRYIAGNKTLCFLSLEDLKKHTIKFTDHVDVLELCNQIDKNENMKKFIEIVYDKKYGKAKERSANTETKDKTKDKMNEQMRWQIQTYISMTSPFAQLCSMEIKTYPQSANPQSANPQSANPQSANPQSANPQSANAYILGRTVEEGTSIAWIALSYAYDFRDAVRDVSNGTHIKLLEKYQNKLNWHNISRNRSITPEIIEKYMEKIDWEALSSNRSLTDELIEKYQNKLNWTRLSSALYLNLEIIKKYIDKWDWEKISENESLDMEILEYVRPAECINMKKLSSNPCITSEMVKKFNIIEKYGNDLRYNYGLIERIAYINRIHKKSLEYRENSPNQSQCVRFLTQNVGKDLCKLILSYTKRFFKIENSEAL
jgi:hypothetical protein